MCPQLSRGRVWELTCPNVGKTSPMHKGTQDRQRDWRGALGAAETQTHCLLPKVLGIAADRGGKGDYTQRGSNWNTGSEMGRGVVRLEMQGRRELSRFPNSSGWKADRVSFFHPCSFQGHTRMLGLV